MSGGRVAGLVSHEDKAYVIPPLDFEKKNFTMGELLNYNYIERKNKIWDIKSLLFLLDKERRTSTKKRKTK